MDAATIKDIITLSVSMTALAITIVLANRQIRLARLVCRDTNSTKALLALNAEYRTDEFRHSEDFVLHHLTADHKTGLGITALPLEARAHVCRVGHFYGDFAMLAVLPTFDRDQILGIVHERVQEVWKVLEPYVRAERDAKGRIYFSYLENLAYVAAGTDKRDLLDRQGLRQIDGSRWVSPPPPRSRRSWTPDVRRRSARRFSQLSLGGRMRA